MEDKPYEHTQWADRRLAQEFLLLQDAIDRTQHEERRLQIGHELASVAFEILSRQREIE